MTDTLLFRSLNCVIEKWQNVLELFLNFLKKLSGHPVHDRLSNDESIVPYSGQHICEMFICRKPIWFGYKLWGLCGPDEYRYKLNIYTGKCETCTEPLGSLVVNVMVNVAIENSVASKHTFYFDNFFSFYDLLNTPFFCKQSKI